MRRDFLRYLLYGGMAFYFGRTARVSAKPPGAAQTTREHDLAAKREWLTTGQWRVWSIAFQLLPAEGFPLQFRPDGGVSSKHWQLSRYWRLTEPDELLLYRSEHSAPIRFGFDVEQQVFVSWTEARPRSLFAVIGPAGTHFPDIAKRLMDDAERGASQHAPN